MSQVNKGSVILSLSVNWLSISIISVGERRRQLGGRGKGEGERGKERGGREGGKERNEGVTKDC